MPRWVGYITLSQPVSHTCTRGNTKGVATLFIIFNPISIHLLDRVSSDWPVSMLHNHWLVCTQDEGCGMMPHQPAHHHCTPWGCQSVCLEAWAVDTHQRATGLHYTLCSSLKLSKRISSLNLDISRSCMTCVLKLKQCWEMHTKFWLKSM
jgi:hypothetical protein